MRARPRETTKPRKNAKDIIVGIKELRKTVSKIEYKMESGKINKKVLQLEIIKTSDRQPDGVVYVTTNSRKKVNGRLVSEESNNQSVPPRMNEDNEQIIEEPDDNENAASFDREVLRENLIEEGLSKKEAEIILNGVIEDIKDDGEVNRSEIRNDIVALRPDLNREELNNIVNNVVRDVKKGGRPKKYATEAERKKAKSQKTVEAQRRREAEAGIIRSNKKGRPKKEVETEVEGGDIIRSITDYGKAIIYGRKDYPPKVRGILSKVGTQKINNIVIKRTPVPSVLTGALSLFSLGKFGKRVERAYDELFHLYVILNLENGQNVLLEKNEVINMDIEPKNRPNTESKTVVGTIMPVSLNDMLLNTKKYMGDKKFYGYSARDNNCQDFIVAFLKSNNLGNNDDFTFIKQNTKDLFNNLPSLRKLSNTITDIGATANVILTGKGVLDNYDMLLKHLTSHITDPKEPVDKKDYEQSKILIDAIKEKKGGKINIGRAFKKLGKDIKKGVDVAGKEIKKDVNVAGKYITEKKGGLSSDLITYGIPSATAAILGAAGNAVGGPALGVLGSAAGSKIGSEFIAPAVHKASGSGVRFKKGSAEAKEYMASIRNKKRK